MTRDGITIALPQQVNVIIAYSVIICRHCRIIAGREKGEIRLQRIWKKSDEFLKSTMTFPI